MNILIKEVRKVKKIKPETPHLFLRLNNYNGYDFIKEHKNCIDKNGYVWLLKVGKTINRDFIKSIIEKNGGIILKSSAKDGNKFYYCNLLDYEIPKNDKEFIFPEYYKEFFDYEGYNLNDLKNTGYWFKISEIKEIDRKIVDSFVICNGKKPMLDVALYTRVVHMYIENSKEIEIK